MAVTTTPAGVAERTVRELRRPRSRTLFERAVEVLLLVATLLGVVMLVVLLVDVVVEGGARLNLDFVTTYSSRFPEQTGIRHSLTGTISLMVLVPLIAFPIGVGAAIYLEEFAPDNRFTRFMQVNIANLAGVPSVVYGLLASAVFVYALDFGRVLLSGAMALSLLILPVIIVAGREAIRAVPPEIRDGGLGLGATRWQAVRGLVLPSAMPGILTGTILAISRAIGEAAPILVAGAVFSRRADNQPWELFEPFAALPIQIFDFVKRPQSGFQIEAASAGILVLLTVLLLMNATAIILRNRASRRY